MNPVDDPRTRFIRQFGAVAAIVAVTVGIARASGAAVEPTFWFALVGAGVMLFLLFGVPSVIDVLAYWRSYTTARETPTDLELQSALPDRPAYITPPPPTTRNIVVHGRGGDGVLTIIDFPNPHEAAWREALARLLWAAKSEGSLKVTALEKYVDHREDVVALTDVLRDAQIIYKSSGVETRLMPTMTFHSALRRVTMMVSPLPLPARMPPTVRKAPILDRSEPVTNGLERSERYAN